MTKEREEQAPPLRYDGNSSCNDTHFACKQRKKNEMATVKANNAAVGEGLAPPVYHTLARQQSLGEGQKSLLQKEKVARVSVTDEVDSLNKNKLLCATEPHQSASLTASPKGEAFGIRVSHTCPREMIFNLLVGAFCERPQHGGKSTPHGSRKTS